MKQNQGITGSSLKIIALITMALDHFAGSVLQYYLMNQNPNFEPFSIDYYLSGSAFFLEYVYAISRLIGRLGFPIFVFLLVEGAYYTKHKARYLISLFVFALISEVPFDLALYEGSFYYPRHQNVFFTLFIGLAIIFLIDWLRGFLEYPKALTILSYTFGLFPGLVLAKCYYHTELCYLIISIFNSMNARIYSTVIVFIITFIIATIRLYKCDIKKRTWVVTSFLILFIGILIARLLKTDYSSIGVLIIAIMYSLRGDTKKETSLACLALTCSSFLEVSSFFIVPIVQLYNGKRGLKLKYFFYIFYPAHLLLFYIICKISGIL